MLRRKPMSEWISVEDGLPDLHEDILAYYEFKTINGHTSTSMCEDCIVQEGRWDTDNNVTHWMPLPEPPPPRSH